MVQLLGRAKAKDNGSSCEMGRPAEIRVMEGEDHVTKCDGQGREDDLAEQLEELHMTIQA